jgi:DNA-binding NarL/FixJ family response regulator
LSTSTTNKISVLLVDDHALVRRGFRLLLEDDPAITVIGEASDGDEAVGMADRFSPQVIVMDCAMPGTSGLAAARRILERRPDIAVLMLSMHDEETLVRQALDAGVRGYVLKNALGFDLAGAVKQVAAGKPVFDAKISGVMGATSEKTPVLSTRQRQVLQLICEGLPNHAIGEKLGISVNTVAVHRAHVMKTLGVRGVAELVAYAIRHGLVGVS